MSQMNMIQAINSAHDLMMEKDPSVVVLGEDVGYFGGVFRCTDGLQKKYGEHRVIDAPIAEGGIIGTAIAKSSLPITSIPVLTRLSVNSHVCVTAVGVSSFRRSRSAHPAAAVFAAAKPTPRAPRASSPTFPALKPSCHPILTTPKAC